MKKKLEIQLIVLLLCLLAAAGAWIGVHIAKDNFDGWVEGPELHFTTPNLLGLAPRSELRCAGATIGHVRKVTPSLGKDGQAQFLIVSRVKRDFVDWKFAPQGVVRAGVVESALAPSSILLELSSGPQAVQARRPRSGPVPVMPLEKETSENDFAVIIEQYRKLGDQIDLTIRQFTEAQNGRSQSVMEEFAQAIPAAASSLRQVEAVTTSLQKEIGENGKIDQTLLSLNASLDQIQSLTQEATKTVANLNGKVDLSLRKVNSLLDETSATMNAVHGKVDGLGGTFVGRMFIGKPASEPKPSPAPPRTR